MRRGCTARTMVREATSPGGLVVGTIALPKDWSDSYGRYQHTNDASYNPNIGATGATWQRMEPVRR